jgi:NAD(P)-dependent dehydrogenase (short-subunit alcohol dehydrogenase family)
MTNAGGNMMASKKTVFDLEEKVALVTGAGQGFGRAFALALAEAGAHVVVAEKVKATLDETTELVKKFGHKVLPLVVDVSSPDDVERMKNDIFSEFKRLDIAVNNAGIIHKPYRLHETPIEEWNRLISINFTGVFICMQKEIELMIKQKSGVIINISSILGIVGLKPDLMPRVSYIAAKHGMAGLTKQAAVEYANDGIRVNAIAPGYFEGTEIAKERLAGQDAEVAAERLKKIIEYTPMKRRGRVEECIDLLLYLSSDASSYVTGQTIAVDGGWTAP